MARVTSKLQVTIPKRIADRYGIRPGSEIEWIEAGDAIRVVPESRRSRILDPRERLALFDAATARQRKREANGQVPLETGGRDWTRDDLHVRGRPG